MFFVKWASSVCMLLSLLVACSTSPKRAINSEKITNEFHDGNEAPGTMRPPRDLSSDVSNVDPLHMSSQADYHYTLGETFSLEGNVDRAIEEFKLTLIYDNSSSVVRGRLATEFARKGYLSEALEQAKISVELDQSSYDARVLLASIYASLKVYDQAETHYKAMIQRFPDKKEAKLHLGALYAEQKKYSEAIHIFRSSAEESSNEQPHLSYYYMGRVYSEADDVVEAEKAFKKAIQLKPSYEEAAIALSKLYESKNMRQKAIALLENVQDKQGNSERLAEILGRYYLEDENYDKAFRQFEVIEAADPSNLNIKVKMALVLIERKSFPQAVDKLKQILIQAPDSDKIRFYLGAVLEEVKDYDSAIEHFMKIPVTSSFYPEAILHGAYLYKQKSEVNRAIQVVDAAIKESPDVEQFYTLYGSLLHENKEYEKAVVTLEQATRRFPKSDQIHFYLGSLYDKVGKRQLALDNMKKVLDINPNHYQSLNYLAYTWAEDNENLKEAEELAKRAISIKAEDAYIQDTLGWVLFKQGRVPEAVKILEVAHKLKPSESIIAEHLGDAYYRAELVDRAKIMYRKAIDLETDQENIRKLNTKLSAIGDTRGNRLPAAVEGNP